MKTPHWIKKLVGLNKFELSIRDKTSEERHAELIERRNKHSKSWWCDGEMFLAKTKNEAKRKFRKLYGSYPKECELV